MTELAVPLWLAAVTLVVLAALVGLALVLAAAARRARADTEALLEAAADDADALRAQLAGIEAQLQERTRAQDDASRHPGRATLALRDHREYVITDIADGGALRRGPQVPAKVLPAPQFADILLRESVIRTVSLAAGLRRALSPEVRNRIRFEMKREVKRSRKERKQMLRQARREWQARGRAEIEVGS